MPSTGLDPIPGGALPNTRTRVRSLYRISPIKESSIVANQHTALRQASLDESRYNGHSFRIGAATTAAQQGLEDSLIQTLGRWRSEAYKIYIKLPRAQLASVSRALAGGQ